MRILSVTPYYKPEGGGLERYAHEVLQRLQRRGHEVKALSFTREGPPHEHEVDGVPVRRCTPLFRLGNAPIHPSFRSRVSHAIASFHPDIVLAHTPVPFPAETAYESARKHDVPFVATYHAGRLRGSSPLLDAMARAYRSTVERRMLQGSARLIAVGRFVQENALAGHEEKTTIIPPGVDADRFHPRLGTPDRSVLFVGPLSSSYEWKGLDTLWEAFGHVQQRVPSTRLTLVGDGDRREALEQEAQAQDLPVRFLGRVSADRLVEAYQNAGLLVLPSTSEAESFGMVLAEANACGRPVVASRIGGIPEFVSHGENGLLADPGDAHDLARRMSEVLLSPRAADRMGQRGRERVARDHDWDDLAKRTERVLLEAV